MRVFSNLGMWVFSVAYGAKINPTLRLTTGINHSFQVPLSLFPDYQGITSSEYIPGFRQLL